LATIDLILPLTTFVSYMGGNSGQFVVELLRCHPHFAALDQSTFTANGGYVRPVWMPWTDEQYAQRLDNHAITDPDIGPFVWTRTDTTKAWLRAKTEEWFMSVWTQHGRNNIDLAAAISSGNGMAIPTHLTPKFLDWIMPESRKIFVIDSNTYFSVRADQAKNAGKHPHNHQDLLRYLMGRVCSNRAFNSSTQPGQNSMLVVRSELICDDRLTHEAALTAIMALHGLEMDQPIKDRAWQLVTRYQAAQRRLGFIAN